MFFWNHWCIGVTIYFGIFLLADSGLITPREMESRRSNHVALAKRPFCNAFTGCGRKRSLQQIQNQQQQQQQQIDPQLRPQFPAPININALGQEDDIENSLSDLIDLNAEPAVEDLMRQIMSQAKLWEAIQEASREISLQKTGHPDIHDSVPLTFNSQ